MRHLSKSVLTIFIVDLMILVSSALFWAVLCGFSRTDTIIATLCFVIISLIVLFLKGNYQLIDFGINFKKAYLIFEGGVIAHVFLGLILLFILPLFAIIKFSIANLFTTYILLLLVRIIFHIFLFKIKTKRNVLIFGTGKDARLIANEITERKALRMAVVGFVEDTENEEEIISSDNFKIFKRPLDLNKIIVDNDIKFVIIAIKSRMEEVLLSEMAFNIPRRAKIFKMPEFYEIISGKYYIDRMSVNRLFYDYMKRRSKVYDFCKRTFDIIAALIILTVTLPITAYIALRVWLTDKGSPFFTQNRVGKNGKTFECYKLRTMYKNNFVPKNSNDVKYAQSVKADDRIIPFCKFVRKARFDEIPQMINILKGDMSIVGPRAEWADEVKVFEKNIPYYKLRQLITAGWTGWSHINMKPVFSIDEEKERLAYDLYYIKHRNLFFDIAILIKAVFLALGGRHK